MGRFLTIILLTAFWVLPSRTLLGANWDEAVSGDLSDVGTAPTFINFTLGSNMIEGEMGWDGSALDMDMWTFTLASGYEVNQINLVAYSAGTPATDHYIAFSGSSTIDDIFNTTNNLSNAYWTWSGSTIDMMALLDAGPVNGGLGFTPPLGAGDYTFLLSETFGYGGTQTISYSMDFVVTAVPEPSSAILLLSSVLMLNRRRRK